MKTPAAVRQFWPILRHVYTGKRQSCVNRNGIESAATSEKYPKTQITENYYNLLHKICHLTECSNHA